MIERRSITLDAQMGPGASPSGPVRITGHAIVYDSRSELLEGAYREVIRPGSIRLADDLLVLAGHNPEHVLGRTSAGTARAWDDGTGIAFEVALPDTAYARDLAASMARGDVAQCSFAMRVRADEWRMDPDAAVREVLLADVLELSVVSMPAYKATGASIT
jgi:hypothetical protein